MYYDEKDYYEILQVSQNASAEVIEAAYRRLAETFHPDNGGTEDVNVNQKLGHLLVRN